MRLWHHQLLPYLPDLQLKGQWRECSLIADAIHKNGTPNHLLVNRILNYHISDFLSYCLLVKNEMDRRGFTMSRKNQERLELLGTYRFVEKPFRGWHNKEYLRVCVANLFEKHYFGIGKSRITDKEWQTILAGYRKITGEEWHI